MAPTWKKSFRHPRSDALDQIRIRFGKHRTLERGLCWKRVKHLGETMNSEEDTRYSVIPLITTQL